MSPVARPSSLYILKSSAGTGFVEIVGGTALKGLAEYAEANNLTIARRISTSPPRG